MKKLLIIAFTLICELLISNPITDFIKQNCNVFNNKAVLITFNIRYCASCSIPVETIVKEIKKQNSLIPVFLITNDSLNETAKKSYLNQIGLSNNSATLICNQELYKYLLNKTKGVDNVSVITLKGKLKSINKIDKNLDIEKIIKEHEENGFIHVIEKTTLKNNYTDYSKSYDAIVCNKNNFILFKKGINIISLYNYKGVCKDVYLDTLPVWNLNFIKNYLTAEEFNNSKQYYNSFNVNKLLTPMSIFKISESEIGISYYLKLFKDSVYKNDSVVFESDKSIIAVIDTNFKLQKLIKFNNSHASKMILESQTAYADSTFYFVFSEGINKYALGQFKIDKTNNTELIIDSLNTFYFKTNKKSKLQIINNSSTNNKVVITIYGLDNKKSSTIYMAEKGKKARKIIYLKTKYVYGAMVYQTESGNLICGVNNKGIFQLEHFTINKKTKKIKKVVKDPFYFVYKGKLFQIAYSEF